MLSNADDGPDAPAEIFVDATMASMSQCRSRMFKFQQISLMLTLCLKETQPRRKKRSSGWGSSVARRK